MRLRGFCGGLNARLSVWLLQDHHQKLRRSALDIPPRGILLYHRSRRIIASDLACVSDRPKRRPGNLASTRYDCLLRPRTSSAGWGVSYPPRTFGSFVYSAGHHRDPQHTAMIAERVAYSAHKFNRGGCLRGTDAACKCPARILQYKKKRISRMKTILSALAVLASLSLACTTTAAPMGRIATASPGVGSVAEKIACRTITRRVCRPGRGCRVTHVRRCHRSHRGCKVVRKRVCRPGRGCSITVRRTCF
jgi:hypothetical protein